MSSQTTHTTESPPPAPKRRLWIYVCIATLLAMTFVYVSYLQSRDNSANHDFYRVLHESSNRLNENLSQLHSMLRNEESASAIRSLLPSFKVTGRRDGGENDSSLNEGDFQYRLSALNLAVESRRFDAQVDVADILPYPRKGFSQYLFAEQGGAVVASIGGDKTISVVDLNTINQEMHEKMHSFRLNLSQQSEQPTTPQTYPLPSYSSHVDMTLSHGEYRIYVFPFTLSVPLHPPKNTQQAVPVHQLYLVGLLPKQQLRTSEPGNWNLSLFVVTLISLFFMWTLLRLHLLPKNQSITTTFRSFTMTSGYAFFIVVIALTLAYMQKSILQEAKDAQARDYATSLSQALDADLRKVFDGLSSFRAFYHSWLQGLAELPENTGTQGSVTADQRVTPDPASIAASTEFSQLLHTTLNASSSRPCRDMKKGLLPAYLFTEQRKYPVSCDNHQVSVDVDHAAELLTLSAYRHDKAKAPVLSMLAGNLTVDVESSLVTGRDGQQVVDSQVESYLTANHTSFLPNNILTVFAFSGSGNTVLPSINYQESNAPPKAFNLSHREYYKNVRDHRGWNLFCRALPADNTRQSCRYSNVYIQRLLNINDGTRGTTISMPMYSRQDARYMSAEHAAFTLGADVILPSVSLAEPAHQDFTYMVVNRNTGEVLFHSDESRTLVENLFFSGNPLAGLTRWIKAGLDKYPVLGDGEIDGNYHGQPGRFVIIPSTVDAWAIVVFYPKDSLDALMTNLFLFVFVSFSVSLLLMVATLMVCRQLCDSQVLKTLCHLPPDLNGRTLIMAATVILAITYCLFAIGLLFDLASIHPDNRRVALFLPLAGLLLHLWVLYRNYKKRYCVKSLPHVRPASLRNLLVLAGVFAVAHLAYLYYVAPMPYKGLAFHYNQRYCNALNQERQEANSMALSRFPNSISKKRMQPVDLMPVSQQYRESLQGNHPLCAQHSQQVLPSDYPRLGTLVGASYLWQWMNAYLASDSITEDAQLATLPALTVDIGRLSLFVIVLMLVMAGWIGFNRRIVWTRLYCPVRFLEHIKRLTAPDTHHPTDSRNPNLIVECDRVKLNGIGLALLLRAAANKDTDCDALLPGFSRLYAASPCLQRFSEANQLLPNLKIQLTNGHKDAKLGVELWDIETCLEHSEWRQALLDVILEFKSLTLANQLASLTIYTGFQSLQRVKMKDPLATDSSRSLEHTEYLSWAECLMDFNVRLPDAFQRGLDLSMLNEELQAMPELAFLREQHKASTVAAEPPLWRDLNKDDKDTHWTTLNYILMHAEAVYRFKWESCSNAEKLALYNLAKGQRINPMNTQMIEYLAINNLIRVKDHHISIINQSFAHFILNAETRQTLNQLIQQGEMGAWKTYRLPVGLLVLLVIGGIAMTSGESIYIIAASVAGVMGTIASVTSGAAMLRGQLKE